MAAYVGYLSALVMAITGTGHVSDRAGCVGDLAGVLALLCNALEHAINRQPCTRAELACLQPFVRDEPQVAGAIGTSKSMAT